VTDIAWVGDENYSHLFVAPAATNRVEVFYLLADNWRDVNPFDGHHGGLDLHSPIIGLDASAHRVGLQDLTTWGAVIKSKTVVATTLNGSVVMMQGPTGCLAHTLEGSFAYVDTVNETRFEDQNTPSNPILYSDPALGTAIQTQSCGGIVRAEDWSLTYDGVEGSWVIEGSISGIQENRAFEDLRYVSDDGGISFVIMAGSFPSSNGDQFTFTTEDGVLRLTSVLRPDGNSELLEIPAPPHIFQYDSGTTGGGWNEVARHSYALVPSRNSNLVVRVRLDSWGVEAIWK